MILEFGGHGRVEHFTISEGNVDVDIDIFWNKPILFFVVFNRCVNLGRVVQSTIELTQD